MNEKSPKLSQEIQDSINKSKENIMTPEEFFKIMKNTLFHIRKPIIIDYDDPRCAICYTYYIQKTLCEVFGSCDKKYEGRSTNLIAHVECLQEELKKFLKESKL